MQFDLTKNIILGQGLTSINTARYLIKKKKVFSIYSLKENVLPKDLAHYYTNKLDDYSMVWMSPGIHKDSPCMQGIDRNKAWLDVDYFLYHYTKPVILVTGTNGKSSVVKIIQMFLLQQGLKAKCYGNFQPGILEALDSDLDWVILELSSFQLEYMRFKGKVSASILLNIGQDHIDWHGSYQAYQIAKLKILSMSDITVGVGGHFAFLEKSFELSKLGYMLQDALNLGAAMELMHQLGFTIQPIQEVPILPYRQNVQYRENQIVVNDSKSTNIASTAIAIQAFREKYPDKAILLILAGIEKSNEFSMLVQLLSYNIKIVIIGENFKAMTPYCYKRYHCIEDAMSCIIEHKGVVLFSPGGASYDQYRNYEERGKDFNRCLFSIREDG